MMIGLDRFLARSHVAYFTMEIALHPDVHTYSGGLGVLAGDTARSCADLEMSVVFVTLMSRQGYLRQEIVAPGRQVDHPDPWDPAPWATPLGAKVAVNLEGRRVWVLPWLYTVRSVNGNGYDVPVILLDTRLPENDAEDQALTDRLYIGDEAYRLKQEAILGIGGVRALRALGFDIHTYHLNEGHSALLTLELLRRHRRAPGKVAEGECGYDVWPVQNVCVFTTHTPVGAGHDRFAYPLVERVLGNTVEPRDLRLLGGADRLNMTQLALSLSGYVNGVAKRHAQIAGQQFAGRRVRAITNGVHAPTWTHPAFARLYDAHLPGWQSEPEFLVRGDLLDGEAIWRAHQEAKRELVDTVKSLTGVSLDPERPIIGNARRMTGYKRPALLFSNAERLLEIQRKYPFQLVYSGKAHPADQDGKALIELIHKRIHELSNAIPIAFLPNYNLALARTLVAGSDVWLNTPQPPLEASGTSGMKAALNGVLNLGVLDGWWIEACIEGRTGWAVGNGMAPEDHAHDAQALYDKLEHSVLRLYYEDRARWTWMMKEAISKIAFYFNSHRMMRSYAAEAYIH